MAKAFSDTERGLIRTRLEKAAEEFMQTRGIKKTSVDELAAAAGISKGAFYQFFPSKEELFFAVIMNWHESIDTELMQKLSGLKSPGAADLVSVIMHFFRMAASSFFPKLIASGEIELLMRKLPPELSARHMETDEEFMSGIVAFFPGLESVSAARYASALRAIFLLLLHRSEIGEAHFDDVLEMLVSGVVARMFNERSQGGER